MTQETWIEINCKVCRGYGVVGFKARVGEGWSQVTEIVLPGGEKMEYIKNGPPWRLKGIIDFIKEYLLPNTEYFVIGYKTNKKIECVAQTAFINWVRPPSPEAIDREIELIKRNLEL